MFKEHEYSCHEIVSIGTEAAADDDLSWCTRIVQTSDLANFV